MGNTPTLSVLICTYQRHDMLRSALAALIDGTDEKPDEVIVVNGGDSQADDVVSAFMGRGVDVRLIRTVNHNLATSRNVGIPACRGDIIAMTDDDAEVFPDWVTQIRRVFAEYPDAGAVGGAVLGVSSAHDFISRLADKVTFPSPDQPADVRNLPGVNVAYRREVIEQIGLQDTVLLRGEDVDYNWRVKRAGYRVLYHPAIRVYHHHRPTLRAFLRQHYMYGRGYFLVRRKWPDIYAAYPRNLSSPRMLLKLVYFGLMTFYEPVRTAFEMPRRGDRLRAVPVLLANRLAWTCGVLYQFSRERRPVPPQPKMASQE